MKIVFVISILLILSSCDDTVKKEYVITEFNKTITDTLYPIKNEGNYTHMYINIKGVTDDSIYVKFYEDNFSHYLKGKIDTTFSSEYYGYNKAYFTFNPYKAKKGNLNITFGIQ